LALKDLIDCKIVLPTLVLFFAI